ncbi:MAG: hydroxymethylglutaryl-CoA synthase family protein [Chitinophagia bacterium]|jgi:hydroxymethylglutaryl-CoA synthase|nr:hydroxymethylglutaryl-CoA synthase family protein [Chitinophagia bacterium]
METKATVGIDAIAFYVPSLFVDIERLAERRSIAYAKLNKGLGLVKMAVPDVHEDAASFGANALCKLIRDSNLDPRSIGRIYMGTESALDASKPTATYAIDAVEKELEEEFGPRCFMNCDVVDMTFACVGAVDALHNSLDWVRGDRNRKAIVLASDVAKYDLSSPGEYTQGAGAVAILVSQDPSVLAITDNWGVATKSEGDFFKPRRVFDKAELLIETAHILGQTLSREDAELLMQNNNSSFWNLSGSQLEVFKEEPVFDGPFSNECYRARITEALENFGQQAQINYLEEWQHLVFHLPYAYQARRMFVENWLQWMNNNNRIQEVYDELGVPEHGTSMEWIKKVSKSEAYLMFVNERIAPGEKASSVIGNMYTASIFMSLLSLLNDALDRGIQLEGQKIGFFSYGSGSKSKVFQAVICSGWQAAISGAPLFEILDQRQEIDVDTYEKLHKNESKSIINGDRIARLQTISDKPESQGLRRYGFGFS